MRQKDLSLGSPNIAIRALRLGSPVCTKKGMGEGELAEIARLLRRVLLEGEEPEAMGTDVAALVASFPSVQYCF